MPWDTPGSTALVVLTREAEPVTGDLYRVHAKAGREGMRPHITLLVPFVPAQRFDNEVDAELRRVLAGFRPFGYSLQRLERFAGGVLYLAPEPTRPFVELTLALTAGFPAYRPYDGIHEAIVPHGTVAVSEDPGLLDRLAMQVQPRLPIPCTAGEVTLVERGPDLRWARRTAYALGELE